MSSYKIVNLKNPNVTSRNSRELKRRIASTDKQYVDYTIGIYGFYNKEGKKVFEVKYDYRNQKDSIQKEDKIVAPAAKGTKAAKTKNYTPRIMGIQKIQF